MILECQIYFLKQHSLKIGTQISTVCWNEMFRPAEMMVLTASSLPRSRSQAYTARPPSGQFPARHSK
jgi:hypothetical protein